jgi:hypothetical protein
MLRSHSLPRRRPLTIDGWAMIRVWILFGTLSDDSEPTSLDLLLKPAPVDVTVFDVDGEPSFFHKMVHSPSFFHKMVHSGVALQARDDTTKVSVFGFVAVNPPFPGISLTCGSTCW